MMFRQAVAILQSCLAFALVAEPVRIVKPSGGWGKNVSAPVPVKAGDAFRYDLELERATDAGWSGAVWAGVKLCDESGKVLSWIWGKTECRLDGLQSLRFVVPEGVATIQPRLQGETSADFVLREAKLTPGKNVSIIKREALTIEKLGNGILELVVEGESGMFAVTDLRTCRTWRSQRMIGASPANAMVTKVDRKGNRIILRLLDRLSLQPFEATFGLEAKKGEVIVEVAGEGSMKRSIDFPSALATADGDRIVLPHNEGISFPVSEDHPVPGRMPAYSGVLSMPFFGVVEDASGAGWMEIVETPSDAAVQAWRDEHGCVSAHVSWDPVQGSFGYRRRARIVFFERGGHVAMCKRYREEAKRKGLLKTFREKAKTRAVVERLPGAVNIWCGMRPAKPVIEEMRNLGIDRILWSGSANPDEIGAIAALPNVLVSRYDVYQDIYHPEQLKRLGWERGANTEAWPDDVLWNSADSNDWARAWGVRTKDGGVAHCARMCDIPAVTNAARKIGEELMTMPYNARFVDVTAVSAWRECYNPRHPMDRRQSRDARKQMLAMIGDRFGLVVGSETGNAVFVPDVDYFEGMLSLCDYRIPNAGRNHEAICENPHPRVAKYQLGEKYRLPLWELVFHDCVCSHWYWGDFSNKMPALWEKRDLFNILYGTMGMFIIDAKRWQADKERFVRSYKKTAPSARATGFSEMTDHRILTADRSVQQTTFADGTQITVNFGAVPWTDESGHEIEASGYRVVSGSLSKSDQRK